MPTNERTAQANGIELCYETHGDPSDEPLLLIMGLSSQLVHWPMPMVDALVDRGFFVVRYDNRDVGLSSKFDAEHPGDFITTFMAASQGEPVEVPYLLTDMAADAVGLLDHLGLDSVHVVGASMGGMIAQTVAIEHPARVRTLTSIMSTTGDRDVGQPTPEAMMTLVAAVPNTLDEALDAAVVTRKVIASPDHWDEDTVRATAKLAIDRCWNPGGSARQLLAIAASGSRADALKELRIPTLVIHGDRDPLVQVSGGERTAEVIPGARLLVLEGMGHDLPAAFIGPIVEAVTAHAATATPA